MFARKNPFKSTGFDTHVSKGVTFNDGGLMIPSGETFVLDGNFFGNQIVQGGDQVKSDTTLVVNGVVKVSNVTVTNLTITGKLSTEVLHAEGTLAIKKGAIVSATEIWYRVLNMEDGAIVTGQLKHLDSAEAGASS
jgi:cytoskeletal protein CcmA (bactofilin family)